MLTTVITSNPYGPNLPPQRRQSLLSPTRFPLTLADLFQDPIYHIRNYDDNAKR